MQLRVPKGSLEKYLQYRVVLRPPTTNPQEARKIAKKLWDASRQEDAEALRRLLTEELELMGAKRRTSEPDSVKAFYSAMILSSLAGTLEALSADRAVIDELLERSKSLLKLAHSMGDEERLLKRLESVRIIARQLEEVARGKAFRELKKAYRDEALIVSFRLPVLRYNGARVDVPQIFSEYEEILESAASRAGIKKRGLKSMIMKAFLHAVLDDHVLEETPRTGSALESELAKSFLLAEKLVKSILE
ncbi:MAG: hypothetical protein GXO07_04870 [Crenarchaeota archaeon]|nr:hypothetical protein [Thermoproteota archaeon]